MSVETNYITRGVFSGSMSEKQALHVRWRAKVQPKPVASGGTNGDFVVDDP
jgi:hypothetical protein